MTQEPVYLTLDGAIAQLILNRPDKRNALTRAMWAAIAKHAAAVAGNPEVKVLVLRGATPAAFAAGADIARVRGSLRLERAGARVSGGRPRRLRRDRASGQADHRHGAGRLLRRRLRAGAVL
jgi:enoyl-CoA hydratase/carnithine racemase